MFSFVYVCDDKDDFIPFFLRTNFPSVEQWNQKSYIFSAHNHFVYFFLSVFSSIEIKMSYYIKW